MCIRDSINMSVVTDFFTSFEQNGDKAPILVSSPHYGRYYPPQLIEDISISLDELRFMEDLFTDELCSSAINYGATLIKANYARAYIDLNRPQHSFDVKLIDGIKINAYCPCLLYTSRCV